MPDINKLNFTSAYPIDKVVATGTEIIVNDGNTTSTGTTTGPQTAKIQTDTIPNPYEKLCFVRFTWSIDGVNFNSAETHLVYVFSITLTDIPITSSNLKGLTGAVSVGVTASTITFLTGNGSHGNVSRLSGDPDDTGYTPTSRTFTINWALYERLPNDG